MKQCLSSKKVVANLWNVAVSMALQVKRNDINVSSLSLSVMRCSISTGSASRGDGSLSGSVEVLVAISAVIVDCAIWLWWPIRGGNASGEWCSDVVAISEADSVVVSARWGKYDGRDGGVRWCSDPRVIAGCCKDGVFVCMCLA
jgi:hypothetical protein